MLHHNSYKCKQQYHVNRHPVIAWGIRPTDQVIQALILLDGDYCLVNPPIQARDEVAELEAYLSEVNHV